MQWLLFVPLGLVFGVIAALPMGPVGVLVFRNTLRGRRRRALLLMVGQATAIFLYVTLVTVGLEGLLLDHPTLFHAIALVGAVLVSGLGIMTLRAARRGAAVDALQTNTNNDSGSGPVRARRYIGTGFILALTNPGVLILMLTAVAVHTSVFGGPPRGTNLAFYLLSVLAGIEGWFLSVVAFLPRIIRRPSAQLRTLRYLEWIAGSLLLAFGLFLLVKQGSALAKIAGAW